MRGHHHQSHGHKKGYKIISQMTSCLPIWWLRWNGSIPFPTERHKLLKLKQGEIDNLNNPISLFNELSQLSVIVQTGKLVGPDYLLVKSIKHLKGVWYQFSKISSRKQKHKLHFELILWGSLLL